MFRRLAKHRFCCDNHEQTYLAELEKIAIERLHNARIGASSRNLSSEIVLVGNDTSSVINREPLTTSVEQTLALMVHPDASRFPAYRAAMS